MLAGFGSLESGVFRHPETLTRREGLSPNEIVNLLRDLSTNESDGGELSCYNLDSDEDIRLSESDCKESEQSADVIDNIPENPDKYVARDCIEWIPHNGNVPGRFATRNVLRQSSGPTRFRKHNINVSFL
ncbi:uncharacterized protein TNCV_1740441 [Trichonephila clavipes]|uniref:Uncharacterized protein n=1 Tax=Trichonephila clavipes TaxID=2585209 RepID=A0A8X6RH30_TRICX|nr:uncharacterized protein TNCV_1740441 [Trichonephila clavipes]